VFTASVPGDGAIKLPISIQHDGFDYVEVGIAPNSDTTITIYPTARIRSGSTLQTRIVSAAPYACGGGSHRCRRIVVEPAGDIVVVEILGTDGADVGLVDDGPPLPPFDYLRSVTVTDGEVYIIGGPAAVTLRARPSKETLVGQFTLTLTHGCLAVPEAARTRTYTASIDPAASGSVVTLGGAAFLMGPICTATASQLGCHQFLASREGDNVRFDLTSADEWHGGYITELIGPGLLEVTGSATGRVEASGDISAAGSGTVWHCTTYFPCPSSQYCEVTDLRLTFKRK
jgi:hypothetical protein